MKKGLSSHVLKVMSLFSGLQMLNIVCSVVKMKLVALWLHASGVGLFGQAPPACQEQSLGHIVGACPVSTVVLLLRSHGCRAEYNGLCGSHVCLCACVSSAHAEAVTGSGPGTVVARRPRFYTSWRIYGAGIFCHRHCAHRVYRNH